ncbi:DNA-3-methyladenine glycosylase family protein [Rhodococcus sp. NPDC058505]|uniref:DNA-3-methyladenine glycosylase family protein n=1 Tax=unclassified Rhodococcus (in: high G+C Gram-positive bacteria) TaxID=192944 RepID=UPI0036645D76
MSVAASGWGASVETVHRSDRPLLLAASLSTLGRGRADPCHRVTADGALWRTSLMPTGPVSYRLVQQDATSVHCRAWGEGAVEFVDSLPDLLGECGAATDFAPEHPKLIEAHRRLPGLRIPRTGRVFEALVPAILEQKVHGIAAHASWRRLVAAHGGVAPGPVPAGMRVPPPAPVWRRIPSWEYHRAGVDPKRSRAIVTAAAVADRLEQAVGMNPGDAEARLRVVPGIGPWTAAEVAQRALGDADALSVGDFHLAAVVGWSLLGRPLDDPGMVAYLEPLRPHRYRVIRLLEVSGQAVKPKFGPRTPVTDHRDR